MKNDFYSWLAVFIVLMIVMSLSTFLALFIRPVVFYFKTGAMSMPIINNLFLSMKVGSFVSVVIITGL